MKLMHRTNTAERIVEKTMIMYVGLQIETNGITVKLIYETDQFNRFKIAAIKKKLIFSYDFFIETS